MKIPQLSLLAAAALGAALLAGPAAACPDLPGYRCGPTLSPHGHEIREDRWERNEHRQEHRRDFRDERRGDRWEQRDDRRRDDRREHNRGQRR